MASERAKRELARFTAAGGTERVIYRPTKGLAREISALVERGAPQELGQGRVPAATVTVLNDELAGICPALLDAGADAIDVAERLGGTRRKHGIQRISRQDADWVTVEVF